MGCANAGQRRQCVDNYYYSVLSAAGSDTGGCHCFGRRAVLETEAVVDLTKAALLG